MTHDSPDVRFERIEGGLVNVHAKMETVRAEMAGNHKELMALMAMISEPVKLIPTHQVEIVKLKASQKWAWVFASALGIFAISAIGWAVQIKYH